MLTARMVGDSKQFFKTKISSTELHNMAEAHTLKIHCHYTDKTTRSLIHFKCGAFKTIICDHIIKFCKPAMSFFPFPGCLQVLYAHKNSSMVIRQRFLPEFVFDSHHAKRISPLRYQDQNIWLKCFHLMKKGDRKKKRSVSEKSSSSLS